MEAFLIDDWMRRVRATSVDADVVRIQDQASLTVARDLARDLGSTSKVPTDVIDRALLVASEMGTNHLRHAKDGHIIVRSLTRKVEDEAGALVVEHHGLEVIAIDRGRGIANVAAAVDAPLAKGPSAPSLGVGIGSILRLSTEVDIDVRRDEGTFIAARLFKRDGSGTAVVPRRAEVGIYGRAFENRPPSGDHVSFLRDEDGDALFLAIADGLGHGQQARDASATAMRVFDRTLHATLMTGAARELDRTLFTIDEALTSTRGAVVTLAHLAPTVRLATARTLRCCAVGNIETQITSFRSSQRLRGTAGMLGQKRSSIGGSRAANRLRSQEDTVIVTRNQALVFASDGISSRCAIDEDAELLNSHPAVIAQRIVETFGRDNDDALVAVIR